MSRIIKCVTFLIAPLLCAGYALSVTRSASAPQANKQSNNRAAKIEGVFQQNCARCHGADGRGETKLGQLYGTPNLADAKLHARFKDKELSAIITGGRGSMPAFKKNLTKAEITALVRFVRRFKQ